MMVDDAPCYTMPESPDGNGDFSSFSRGQPSSSTRRGVSLLRSEPPSGSGLVVGGRLLRAAVEDGISSRHVLLFEVGPAVPNASAPEPVFFVDHGLDAAGQRAWRAETSEAQKRGFLEGLREKCVWGLREWADRVERGESEKEGLLEALENICETGRNREVGKVVLGVASGASAATTLSVGLAMSGAVGLAVIAAGATAGYVAGRYVRRETENPNLQMCGEYATRLRAQKRRAEEMEECAAKLQRLAVFYGMHSYRDLLAAHPGEFFRVLDELIDKRQ